MKLLLCTQCNDVVKFGPPMQWRSCVCGRSSARYLEDGYHAEITGDFAHTLGLDNHSIKQALKAQGSGRALQPRLDGWLFDRNYYRVARVASKGASSHPLPRRPIEVLHGRCPAWRGTDNCEKALGHPGPHQAVGAVWNREDIPKEDVCDEPFPLPDSF